MNFTVDVVVPESREVTIRLPEGWPIGHYKLERSRGTVEEPIEIHLEPEHVTMWYGDENSEGLRMASPERSGIVRELRN